MIIMTTLTLPDWLLVLLGSAVAISLIIAFVANIRQWHKGLIFLWSLLPLTIPLIAGLIGYQQLGVIKQNVATQTAIIQHDPSQLSNAALANNYASLITRNGPKNLKRVTSKAMAKTSAGAPVLKVSYVDQKNRAKTAELAPDAMTQLLHDRLLATSIYAIGALAATLIATLAIMLLTLWPLTTVLLILILGISLVLVYLKFVLNQF